jgi:hypothetical protein
MKTRGRIFVVIGMVIAGVYFFVDNVITPIPDMVAFPTLIIGIALILVGLIKR